MAKKPAKKPSKPAKAPKKTPAKKPAKKKASALKTKLAYFLQRNGACTPAIERVRKGKATTLYGMIQERVQDGNLSDDFEWIKDFLPDPENVMGKVAESYGYDPSQQKNVSCGVECSLCHPRLWRAIKESPRKFANILQPALVAMMKQKQA